MEKNKTSRYLKYAIGEIILVVIGILIALQINNWNESTQLQKVEQATLNVLLSEFKDNQESLKEYLNSLKEDIKYADTLRQLLGPEPSIQKNDKINRLFGEIGSTKKAVITVDVLDDIRTSGKLNVIRNEDIRRAISKWSSQYKSLQGEENDWAQEFSAQFIPYTNKWIQWDDVDYLYNTDDSEGYFKSKFNVDSQLILQQPEFANILSIHYWRHNRVHRMTENLLKQTDTAITNIEKGLVGNKRNQ